MLPIPARRSRSAACTTANRSPPTACRNIWQRPLSRSRTGRFYSHHGIDLRGILRAAWHNLSGRGVEGGSTITQQLARVRYLSTERSLRRKVQEVMLALWLEARLGKREILARYLNTVYFGAGAVGADAAAKRYFGK